MEIEGSSLSPWQIKVQITPEIATDAFETINLVDNEVSFKELLSEIYSEQDFQNKTFLNCGCDCGAYCFWARSVGFKWCFGFDIKEQLIKQAEWLKENITTGPTDFIQFKKMDLYELKRMGLPQFDLTLFNGLFCHLPHPILGLQIAADATKDVLIVNTKTRPDAPKNCFMIREEEHLAFIPSGPDSIISILKRMGFVRFKVSCSETIKSDLGRTQVIAYRRPERIIFKQNKKVKI